MLSVFEADHLFNLIDSGYLARFNFTKRMVYYRIKALKELRITKKKKNNNTKQNM